MVNCIICSKFVTWISITKNGNIMAICNSCLLAGYFLEVKHPDKKIKKIKTASKRYNKELALLLYSNLPKDVLYEITDRVNKVKALIELGKE